MIKEKQIVKATPPAATMYADAPDRSTFAMLQQNLQNCLAIVDNEVMKNYVPALQNCAVVPVEDAILSDLGQIQFFRLSELVYQEDEFSVHKLATIFSAVSNKPCTLVLMIQSDGRTNEFYLGIRSRDGRSDSGTMRTLLEQSLLGLFPGSKTEPYYNENLKTDLNDLHIGAVSSVTCIADYKQETESLQNKAFIQGLEKFIYSMQGKAFTAICIANNLEHRDLVATRKEYERIYTLMSPFANMQYNYSMNQSAGITDSDTTGSTETDSSGTSMGVNLTESTAWAVQQGTNTSRTMTDTEGKSSSVSMGKTHTEGVSDGTSDSESTTTTVGVFASKGKSFGINIEGISIGSSTTKGVSTSVARGRTHGTSHTDTVSDSVSKSLTQGINTSRSVGNTIGENQSMTDTTALGIGSQYSQNTGHSIASNLAHTKALSETFGNSQAITLNVQNKELMNTLQRLEKQLERLDECESIGMWDFAAYFLGESAAEAETAASMYRSLVSGTQSGLEIAAVNTWIDSDRVMQLSKYVTNFVHPVFSYRFEDGVLDRETLVDATALASTNELAIQLGLPRKSVKGLPVIEHALFAQEVLNENPSDDRNSIVLGTVNHLGRATDTTVNLDLQSLSMHTFITGSTGSGKSNTVYQILSQLPGKNVKFLVVEPAKGEYRNVFRKNVSVYGTNPRTDRLLRINPFSFPQEIHIYEHLDRLVEIFNVCWPMYAAMPAILKDAIERSYKKAGWDLRKSVNRYSDRLFPNFTDVLREIDAVMDQSQYSSDSKGDYKGALSTRLRSLTNGINGLVFTSDEISSEDLFDKNVIVDLSRVGSSETKSLIMGLLVMKLQEHRMATCSEMNASLKHITVLEEAHNLLKRTSTEQSSEGANLLGKSVEMLTNAIAEMRTYGEGFIIADQSPGLLDMAVIRNTNTKIIMRLPEYSDRELVGRAASLNEEQITELAKLTKGTAAIYQNDWLEAVLCKVNKHSTSDEHPVKSLAEKIAEHQDVKGELVSRMLSNRLYHLTDGISNDDIIKSDMPATAKCLLLQYEGKVHGQKLDAVAAITYELFNARPVLKIACNRKMDDEQLRSYICSHLEPSLDPLPADKAQVILYLVIYHHAKATGSGSVKLLLDNFLKSTEKEGELRV